MRHSRKLVFIALLLSSVLAFSQTNKSYVVITYSSICCGAPSGKPIMDYLIKFERDNQLKSFEVWIERGLGKEGEYAFYIGSDYLSAQLLKSFLKGLKRTANRQNESRVKNKDGFVAVQDKLVSNATVKSLRITPRN